MLESYPSWFWVVGTFISPMKGFRDDLPKDAKLELLASAKQGLSMFLSQPGVGRILPRAAEKAEPLFDTINDWFVRIGTDQDFPPLPKADTLTKAVHSWSVSLQDELDRMLTYTVMPKGSLDIRMLVNSFSEAYPKSTRELLNDFVCEDINHAGRCLAFNLPTSSGFHILRAVETCAKAYVHAATGVLPNIKNRNWGEYIERLKNANAHDDVIDLLRILKAKRNPLMHPYDNLDVDEAISLLCLCQSGIDTIIADLRRRTLELTFQKSLKALPTL